MEYRIIKRTYGVITEYMPQRKWLGIWWNISTFWCRCYSTAEDKILESKARRQKKIYEVIWEEQK